MNNKNSVKTVVAVAIGAALFFVLGRFVAIPSGIPNTNISLQYAVLGLLAAMYGPVAGGLIGFIGHTLIDLSWGGSPWWSWVIASTFVGIVVGLFAKKLNVNEGEFSKKDVVTYAIANVIAHAVAWIGGEVWGMTVFRRQNPRRDELSDMHQSAAMQFALVSLVGILVIVGFIYTTLNLIDRSIVHIIPPMLLPALAMCALAISDIQYLWLEHDAGTEGDDED